MGALLWTTALLAAAPTPVERVLESVRYGDGFDALNRARKALEAAPGDPALTRLVVLLARATQAPDAAKLGKELGVAELPALPDVPPQRPVAGPGKAWVGATSLRLRQGPGPKDVAIVSLSYGVELVVEALEGQVARVHTARPWALPPTADPVLGDGPAFSATVLTGYMAVAYLDAEAPSLAAVQKRAADAGNGPLAVGLRMRAYALAQQDEAVMRALVDQAIAAERYELALPVARLLSRIVPDPDCAGPKRLSPLDVAIFPLFGCRGDFAAAKFVQLRESSRGKKKLGSADFFDASDPQMSGGPPKGLGALWAKPLCLFQNWPVKNAKKLEERLRAEFNDPPRVSVCLRNDGPLPYAEPRPLYWVSYPYSTQEQYWNGELKRVEVLAGEQTVRALGALPVLGAGAYVCFSVPATEASARAFGVALAADEKAARAALSAAPEGKLCDPAMPGRQSRDLWLEWTPAAQGRVDDSGE